ncbi:MAG: ammonium transporter [Acidobacteria bacterium]|nr:ammonium transporter [Acidobacteriota bacterium]
MNAESVPVRTADLAWMLVASALVLLMTPALACFYAGMVRSKNALNTMMMSVVALGPVALIWALAGYSLAFAPGNALVGALDFLALRGVDLSPHHGMPHLLFMAFQGTFAVITTALIIPWSLVRIQAGPVFHRRQIRSVSEPRAGRVEGPKRDFD